MANTVEAEPAVIKAIQARCLNEHQAAQLGSQFCARCHTKEVRLSKLLQGEKYVRECEMPG